MRKRGKKNEMNNLVIVALNERFSSSSKCHPQNIYIEEEEEKK